MNDAYCLVGRWRDYGCTFQFVLPPSEATGPVQQSAEWDRYFQFWWKRTRLIGTKYFKISLFVSLWRQYIITGKWEGISYHILMGLWCPGHPIHVKRLFSSARHLCADSRSSMKGGTITLCSMRWKCRSRRVWSNIIVTLDRLSWKDPCDWWYIFCVHFCEPDGTSLNRGATLLLLQTKLSGKSRTTYRTTSILLVK
jgi:hypothetical protein